MTNELCRAIKLLNENLYTCVFCKGETEYSSEERGVKPLVNFLSSGVDLKSYSVADKVIGKAAALLYVLMGIKEVFAYVMSDSAINIFKKYGIESYYDLKVKLIRNRSGTGECPMEETVAEIDDPEAAFCAIKRKIDMLEGSIHK